MGKESYNTNITRIKIVFVILFVIFLSSCKSYMFLSVETLEPATIPLVGEKEIGFLDRNIRLHSNSSNKLYDSDAIHPDEVAYLFYASLEQTLKEENIIDTLYPLTGKEKIYVSGAVFPKEIDSLELKDIFNVYGINYLISLENSGYFDNKRASGKFYCLKVYSKDSLKSIGRDILRYNMSYILANSYKEMLNNEFYVEKVVREYATKAGSEYAKMFIPDWKYTERRVYNKGKVLKFGYQYFKKDELDKAALFWEGGLKLRPTKAIQAAINMAWLHEDKGEFDKSLEYLNKGKEIAKINGISNDDTKYLNSYHKLLTKRKENIKKIGLE